MGSGAGRTAAAQVFDATATADNVRSEISGGSTGSGGNPERIFACFQKWDVDSSGTISVHELMRVLELCGVSLEAKEISTVFSTIDTNKDGVIDYKEFVEWLYPSAAETLMHDSPISPSSPSRPPARTPQTQPSDGDGPRLTSSTPVLVHLHSAAQLPNYSSSSESDASAVAFVSKSGQPMEPKVQWPVLKRCNNPCWNLTRDLGCHTYACHHAENELLHIELRGNGNVIGEVKLPLGEIVLDHWYERDVELSPAQAKKNGNKPPPSIRFQILTPPPLVKKVFLVRHGESAWNKAQREKKVSQLIEQVDHPLTDEGIQQCLSLQGKILKAQEAIDRGEEISASEAQFLNAQIAISSPLSRAIQTALLGVHPILRRLQRLRLCRNAREKRNMGGLDTTGTAVGEAEILKRVQDALRHCGTKDEDIDRYLAVPLDTTEADNRWWNDSRESSSEVKKRLSEFIDQMRLLREKHIVVVGHSHFFRALVKQGLTSSAKIAGASRADVLAKKLVNCGVMAITLDFRQGADQPINEVELLLNSGLC